MPPFTENGLDEKGGASCYASHIELEARWNELVLLLSFLVQTSHYSQNLLVDELDVCVLNPGLALPTLDWYQRDGSLLHTLTLEPCMEQLRCILAQWLQQGPVRVEVVALGHHLVWNIHGHRLED